MNLLMIRHGEIPSNINKVYAGRSPEGLTEKGVQQAKQVSEKLKKHNINTLYSSPIQRALQTARIISDGIGIDLKVDNAFRELELGPWEGSSENDIARNYPDEWKTWQTRPDELIIPKRETLNELLERVVVGIQRIYQQAEGHTIVIVTHVAIIRVLMLWDSKSSLNLYKTIHVPNAEIFTIKMDSYRSL